MKLAPSVEEALPWRRWGASEQRTYLTAAVLCNYSSGHTGLMGQCDALKSVGWFRACYGGPPGKIQQGSGGCFASESRGKKMGVGGRLQDGPQSQGML